MIDKRQQLLETALKLFYANGVQAVGINEVLKVSGIAKKTLYHHYSSKESLVLAALEYRDSKFTEWFEGLIEGSKSNHELAVRMFEGLSQWFNNGVERLDQFRGCFFINTSAEFSEPDSPISDYCRKHKAKIREIIAKHMVEEDEDLLDCLCILKEGAIVAAYVARDKDAAEHALKIAENSIKQKTVH